MTELPDGGAVSAEPAWRPPAFATAAETLAAPELGPHRRVRDIEFAMVPGFRPLRMDLLTPEVAGPVPVVVWIHGGAFLGGSRVSHQLAFPIWRALLAAGLAVASVEYRLSGEARFPACLHDVTAAIRWLRRFGPEVNLDPDRIATMGESAGGYLAAFAGLNLTDPDLTGELGVHGVSAEVQATVAWYPPTDFLLMDTQVLAGSMPHDPPGSPESLLIGGALQSNREAAAYASPVTHVGIARHAPMLLIHGADDRAVPHQQTLVLAEALRATGAEVDVEIVPGAGHVFEGVDPAPIITRSVAFLADRLSVAQTSG